MHWRSTLSTPARVIACVVLGLSSANAFNTSSAQWPSNSISVEINAASFANNLSTVAMSEAQASFWVAFSLGNWKERTGANINISYGGTNTVPAPTAACFVDDGVNTIHMHPTCGEPACTTTGLTTRQFSGSSVIEADLCVFNDAADWRVLTSDITSGSDGRSDLISTLTHEFGHFLGLAHTANTVMNSSVWAGTLKRYPLGDDIKAVRSSALPYGTLSRTKYWKSISTGNWNSEKSMGGGMEFAPSAAVGKRSSSAWNVITTRTSSSGTRVHFTRSNYPLSSSSSWSNRWSSQSTWRPVAIAGKTEGSDRYVAAWTQAKDTLGCNGIRVGRTTNNFDSLSTTTLSSACSVHEPALAYDPNSNRFVMFYVLRAWGSSIEDNDRLAVRTSTNGSSWSTEQLLSFKTIDAPSIACSDSQNECILSYIAGDSLDANMRSRSFTVNSSTGSVSLSGAIGNANEASKTPAAGVYRRSGSSRWFAALPFTSDNVEDWMNSEFSLWTNDDSDNPINSFSSWKSIAAAFHRPALAMADTSSTTTGYAFYVR